MKGWIFASLPIALVMLAVTAWAGPELIEPQAESRWSVSAGVSVRSLNAAFDFSPTTATDWRNFIAAPGSGDPGLFTGGSEPVVYDNGIVGGENPNFAGFGAAGRVDSASQISAASAGVNTNNNSLARTVTFESLAYDDSSRFATTSDQPAGTGPTMQLNYLLGESMGTTFELQTGWSFVSSEAGTGSLDLFPVYQITNSYLYDYIADPNLPLSIPGDVHGSSEFLLYDSQSLPGFFGSGFQGPRRGNSERDAQTYAAAVSSAELDTNLFEIPLGLAAWRNLGPMQVGFTGGATINILDYDLRSQLAWYQTGITQPAAQRQWSQSGTHLKLGMFAGLSARLPISADERVFLEATGSYRWIDPVHATAGPVEVEIDGSSAEGRIGVGIVLK